MAGVVHGAGVADVWAFFGNIGQEESASRISRDPFRSWMLT